MGINMYKPKFEVLHDETEGIAEEKLVHIADEYSSGGLYIYVYESDIEPEECTELGYIYMFNRCLEINANEIERFAVKTVRREEDGELIREIYAVLKD